MSYMLDGKDIHLGDKLYDLMYGWVTVIGTIPALRADTRWYGRVVYTNEGKLNYSPFGMPNRTLFWGEPVFEIPKPPKKMVKAYQVLYKDSYGFYCVSGLHYRSLDKFANAYPRASQASLIENSMIEEEE